MGKANCCFRRKKRKGKEKKKGGFDACKCEGGSEGWRDFLGAERLSCECKG